MTSDYMIKGYGYSLGVVEIEPIKAASLREAKERRRKDKILKPLSWFRDVAIW